MSYLSRDLEWCGCKRGVLRESNFKGEVNKKKKDKEDKSESYSKQGHKRLCIESPRVLNFWWSNLCYCMAFGVNGLEKSD